MCISGNLTYFSFNTKKCIETSQNKYFYCLVKLKYVRRTLNMRQRQHFTTTTYDKQGDIYVNAHICSPTDT